MFCSAFGSEVQEGLRFCNRCGANLTAGTENASRLFGIILTLAIAALLIGVIGLTALFFFAIELMGRGTIPAEIVIFLIVFSLVFFGIEALIIQQLSRLSAVYLQKDGATAPALKDKRRINNLKAPADLPDAQQDFIRTTSLHTTAPDEEKAAKTTRILPTDEPETRRLEINE